jgi:hypothetical protein
MSQPLLDTKHSRHFNIKGWDRARLALIMAYTPKANRLPAIAKSIQLDVHRCKMGDHEAGWRAIHKAETIGDYDAAEFIATNVLFRDWA